MPGDPIVSVNFVGLQSAEVCFEATPAFWFKSDIVKHFTQADRESGKPFA
ncbi:MAG: hypothetical protein ACI83Y_000574 [Candidatus Azotimanducaceae bacterium]|jgi:hypothetical protein